MSALSDDDFWLGEYGANRDAGMDAGAASRVATIALRCRDRGAGSAGGAVGGAGVDPAYIHRLRHWSAGTEGASGAFAEECMRRTGAVRGGEAALEMLRDSLRIIGDTNLIANACERAGMRVRFASTPGEAVATGRRYCPPISAVSLWDGSAVEFPNLRRCQCFPTVMKARRSGMQVQLEYFVRRAQARGRKFRHVNFTSGTRWREGAMIGEIGASTREFHRALSALFRSEVFAGVFSPVMMGIEFGKPKVWRPQRHFSVFVDAVAEHDDAAPAGGGITLHLHCHVIVEVTGEVVDGSGNRSKAAWNEFMNRLRVEFGAILSGGDAVGLEECRALVEDCGALRSTEEACKYPLKTEDLKSIAELGSHLDLAEFCRQMRHLRLVTPRGDFADFRRRLKRRHKKVIRGGGNGGLRVIDDPNWLGFEPPERVKKKREESGRKRGETEAVKRAVNARFLGFARAWEALERGLGLPAETPAFDPEVLRQMNPDAPLKMRVFYEARELFEKHGALLDFFKCPFSLLEELMRWCAPSCPVDVPECAFREAEAAKAAEGAGGEADEAEIKAVVNRMFSITLPTWFGGSRVAAPYAFVAGYNGDFGAVVEKGRPRVVHDYVREALRGFEPVPGGERAARALMGVHNIHITFPGRSPPGGAGRPESAENGPETGRWEGKN